MAYPVNVGIFGKAVDSRTQSILNKYFGQEVAFEAVAGGQGSGDGLTVNLRPFMCAFTELGLVFINQGSVVLGLSWQSILYMAPSKFSKNGYELIIQLKDLNRLNTHLEYPFNRRFNLDLKFNNDEHCLLFEKMFYDQKSKNGFNAGRTEQARIWSRMSVKKPVIWEDFLKANINWEVSEEIKRQSYLAWGELQDAETLLYYVASGISYGFIPPRLIDRALEIFIDAQNRNGEFTKQKFSLSDDNKKLAEDLRSLPDTSNTLNDFQNYTGWIIGKIETSADAQKPVIELPMRWTVMNLAKGEGLPNMRILDFLYEGEIFSYMLDKNEGVDLKGHLIGAGIKFEINSKDIKEFKKYPNVEYWK